MPVAIATTDRLAGLILGVANQAEASGGEMFERCSLPGSWLPASRIMALAAIQAEKPLMDGRLRMTLATLAGKRLKIDPYRLARLRRRRGVAGAAGGLGMLTKQGKPRLAVGKVRHAITTIVAGQAIGAIILEMFSHEGSIMPGMAGAAKFQVGGETSSCLVACTA